MAEQKESDGFKSLQEAQGFMNSFGNELVKTLNGDKDIKESDDLVTKYLNVARVLLASEVGVGAS